MLKKQVLALLCVSIDRRFFWITLALLVKLLIFINGIAEFSTHEASGFIGAGGGDAFSYLDPLENFLSTGHYAPDFRMPGMAPAYLPFRLFISAGMAQNAVIIMQWILASVSVYCLAKTVYMLTRSATLFYMVFYIFLISTYSNLYDYRFLSDSFCCSACVFFIHYLVKYDMYRKNLDIFLAGVFFTWIVFLRQVYIFIPLIAVYVIYRLIREKNISIRQGILSFFIFCLSFMVFDGWWIARNVREHHELIPLRKSIYYEYDNHDYLKPLSMFVISFGGDLCFWDPKAEIRWFDFGTRVARFSTDGQIRLPGYIYTSQFNKDSLLVLKTLITASQAPLLTRQEAGKMNERIEKTCMRYEASIKQEKPFLYHVSSRFIVACRFIFMNGTYNLFNKSFGELDTGRKAIKLFYEALYKLLAVLSVLGIFFFPYKNRMSIFFFMVLYAFIYPLGFRYSEYRYLVPAYPFMVASACCLLWYYKNKWFTSSAPR